MKKPTWMLSIASAAGALLLTAAIPASADTTFSNTKTQYLSPNPNTSMADSCTNELHEITITSARNYTWEWYGGPTARTIYLAAGTYYYYDCLWPESGYYGQTSELNPLNSNYVAVQINRTVTNYGGTTTWGSELVPS